MKKLLLYVCFLCIINTIFSQDFFRREFNKEKNYIILTNPTVQNIELIHFLIKKDLLDIDTSRINFVGVYFNGQKYDFSNTVEYMGKNKPAGFFLVLYRSSGFYFWSVL